MPKYFDFPVIDADGHVQELNIDWAGRIAPSLRDRAPRVVPDNRGFPRLLAEGKLWPKPEGRGTGQAGGPRSRRPGETTGMHDPVRRLQDMDLEGIDTVVLFGTSLYLSLPFFEDVELAAGAARSSLEAAPASANAGCLAALAQAEFAGHHFKTAREHAERLVEMEPRKSYPYRILGDALVELGEYERAAEAF